MKYGDLEHNLISGFRKVNSQLKEIVEKFRIFYENQNDPKKLAEFYSYFYRELRESKKIISELNLYCEKIEKALEERLENGSGFIKSVKEKEKDDYVFPMGLNLEEDSPKE